jgi:hypothetical protein
VGPSRGHQLDIDDRLQPHTDERDGHPPISSTMTPWRNTLRSSKQEPWSSGTPALVLCYLRRQSPLGRQFSRSGNLRSLSLRPPLLPCQWPLGLPLRLRLRSGLRRGDRLPLRLRQPGEAARGSLHSHTNEFESKQDNITWHVWRPQDSRTHHAIGFAFQLCDWTVTAAASARGMAGEHKCSIIASAPSSPSTAFPVAPDATFSIIASAPSNPSTAFPVAPDATFSWSAGALGFQALCAHPVIHGTRHRNHLRIRQVVRRTSSYHSALQMGLSASQAQSSDFLGLCRAKRSRCTPHRALPLVGTRPTKHLLLQTD